VEFPFDYQQEYVFIVTIERDVHNVILFYLKKGTIIAQDSRVS